MTNIDKLMNLAKSDIGYTESPANSNRTKFGKWYGMDGEPWCMMAVQYWYNAAGMKLHYKSASCSALLNWYKKQLPECVVKSPKRGDIVIYTFGHTGIVESYKSGYVTCIEGNTSSTNSGSQDNGGGVFRRTRSISTVKAYIRPYKEKELTTDGVRNEEQKEQKQDNETEDEDEMTGKQIYDALQEYLKQQSVPDWANAELQEAMDMGLTDGTNGCMLTPRYQTAIMCKRAVTTASAVE